MLPAGYTASHARAGAVQSSESESDPVWESGGATRRCVVRDVTLWTPRSASSSVCSGSLGEARAGHVVNAEWYARIESGIRCIAMMVSAESGVDHGLWL
ncbi:unnamed protein product [Mycena citricolor]|uniref:Uncharacterized protein n=1 Tax=Mycena citricolor TaxID=2018698 RepID=A0AAD2JZI0_9AGAR|nr:unnamed protein product [Mycena citricolor]